MADRIDLSYFATDYPMPEGVRRLMPFQELPFNGDGYAAAEVERLTEKHHLNFAIETGTCYGSSTLFISECVGTTHTFEIDGPSLEIARQRVTPNNECFIYHHHCESVEGIRHEGAIFAAAGIKKMFIFLDAHWGQHCPLLNELDEIARQKVRPVIMIHDFQVPGRPDLGFDRFPDTGNPFNLEAIAPYLDKIYGADGWDHHYNDEAEGAKRGIIYIEPK